MEWRHDEATLEEVILVNQAAEHDQSQRWRAMGELIVLRSANGITYQQVLKWPVSQVGRAVSEALEAMPKGDGLDPFRRGMND
jgi:hypothetical protein